ncbi:transcription termination/antitermination NusG family protein [Serratia fonticola]|uniref:transcription termination/antitermination NusG family protein n=1 Tax=Serratia fonticola TaxID=47917 RepID=UPI00301C53A7
MEQWYLACHKTGKDSVFRAMGALTYISGTAFCPQIRVFRPRQDRPGHFRQVVEPLFPGYLFIAFDPEITHTSKIEHCPGISYLVRTAGEIKPIRNIVVDEIMRLPVCYQSQENQSPRQRRSPANLIQQRRIAGQLDTFVKETAPDERGALFLAFLDTLEATACTR